MNLNEYEYQLEILEEQINLSGSLRVFLSKPAKLPKTLEFGERKNTT